MVTGKECLSLSVFAGSPQFWRPGSKTIVVTKDDGIRADTTAAGLGKLRPAFKPDGTTTAGNSSQVSDGAAGVLLMRRSHAAALGLPALATIRSYAVVGVEPDVMGTGCDRGTHARALCVDRSECRSRHFYFFTIEC